LPAMRRLSFPSWPDSAGDRRRAGIFLRSRQTCSTEWTATCACYEAISRSCPKTSLTRLPSQEGRGRDDTERQLLASRSVAK
jgi:hypothetical protein